MIQAAIGFFLGLSFGILLTKLIWEISLIHLKRGSALYGKAAIEQEKAKAFYRKYMERLDEVSKKDGSRS